MTYFLRVECRPVKFFHTNLNKPFLYGPFFVLRGIVILKQEKAFPKLLPPRWKHIIVGTNAIVCCSFKGPRTNSPRPLSLLQQTLVSTMYSGR
jgi:hypothetical protein